MGACRENGKRLAERVDKVEGDLERCTNQNLLLEAELKDVKSRKQACETENDKLRRQVEGGAFIDFKEFVGSLGTGGYVLPFALDASFGMKTMPFFLVIRGCVRTPPDRGPTDMSLNEHLTQPSLSKLGQPNSVMLSILLPLLSSRLQSSQIFHLCIHRRPLHHILEAIQK